jgi:vitamin B12/bleomycin/antimicrobial peptide transport system ATP-binding/permease protein
MPDVVGGPKALDIGPQTDQPRPPHDRGQDDFERRSGAERRIPRTARPTAAARPSARRESHVAGIDVARTPIEADIHSPPPDNAGARHELGALARALWASAARRHVGLLGLGIAAVIGANVVGQVRLNRWYGDFFDALQKLDLHGFAIQLLVFGVVVLFLLILVVAQTWMGEMLKIRLRDWLTRHLLDEWLVPGRAFRLAAADRVGINPDQRIAEDARKLTDLSASLSVGLFQATLLLVSFVGILWVLSDKVVFMTDGEGWRIPGYMVWCAVTYALAGTLLTWKVGFPLIDLNAERYAREADLRFDLVRVSDNAEVIAIYNGERDEQHQLEGHFALVVVAMRRLCNALARLTWITSGYGWIAIVVPIVVAAPGYFSGGLTLGDLMMVVGAFNQVQQSLRWFVDNFPGIADWRATLHRVCAFRAALLILEEADGGMSHISLSDDPEGRLVLDDVSLLLSDGRVRLAERQVEIAPGERVRLDGGTDAGASTLFRAIGGLWPWGSGSIRRPPRDSLMILPQHPYLPLGGLRAALAYPLPEDAFDRGEIEAALIRVGLGDLLPMLDQQDRVDKMLSLGHQQLVAFVRVLLHRPRWLLLDQATSAMDEAAERQALSILTQELADTAVLCVGHNPYLTSLCTRTLELTREPEDILLHQSLKLRPGGIWRWSSA